MKKTYEGLEMEVIRFSTEDIITTSEATTNNNDQTTTQNQTPTQTETNVLAPTQDQTGTNNGTSESEITYKPVEGYLAVFLGSDGNYYSLNLSTNEYELIGPELPTSEEGV